VETPLSIAQQANPNTDPALREIYHAIPVVVPVIREFWMPHRFDKA
jgi:hypothetical protein